MAGWCVPKSLLIRLAGSLALAWSLLPAPAAVLAAQPAPLGSPHGVAFTCMPERLPALRRGMAAYLASLGLAPVSADSPQATSPAAVLLEEAQAGEGRRSLRYFLPSAMASAWGTVFLAWQPQWAIHDETVQLPAPSGGLRAVATVSRKEIVLALLSPGRLTRLPEGACDVQALVDHVGVRQNIVAWSEDLAWVWPDGAAAFWNRRYWRDGTPRRQVALADALNDVFFNPRAYGFGCYAATRLVFVQGIYDYYRRVKRDASQARAILARLMADGDPLVDVEPPATWLEQPRPEDIGRPGKMARELDPVAPLNFVPGDWAYIRNTDPVSSAQGGYEGSNTLYLGRNRFDDYYNDNVHAFNLREKLQEVYAWRHGMITRLRDFALLQPVTHGDVERLAATPAEGGLLEGSRIVPYFFGYEVLPPLSVAP